MPFSLLSPLRAAFQGRAPRTFGPDARGLEMGVVVRGAGTQARPKAGDRRAGGREARTQRVGDKAVRVVDLQLLLPEGAGRDDRQKQQERDPCGGRERVPVPRPDRLRKQELLHQGLGQQLRHLHPHRRKNLTQTCSHQKM